MGESLQGFGADQIKTGFHGNQILPLTYNRENVVSMIAPSFFIGSSSYLQVIRTGIKSQTSLISGLKVSLEVLVTTLTSNQGIRLDYLLWSYLPLRSYYGKNINTIAPFFIGSSSDLQVMRTGRKSWTSSIWGQIGLFAFELLAIEHQKKFPKGLL